MSIFGTRGFASSELWFKVLATGVSLLIGYGVVNADQVDALVQTVVAVASLGAGLVNTVSYAANRTQLKMEIVKTKNGGSS